MSESMSLERRGGLARRRARAPYAWGALALLVAIQAAFVSSVPRAWQAQLSPGAPPSLATALAASLGERRAASYALALYLQSFDAQAGQQLRLRTLDYDAVLAWLDRAQALAPDGSYPLFLAARIYADAAPAADARRLLDWVRDRFLESPARRWRWLAHAVFLARHRVGDLHLARDYAHTLRAHTTPAQAPRWARDLEVFLLADLDELQAARALVAGLIDSGEITDPAERDLLLTRLAETEGRQRGDERTQADGRAAEKVGVPGAASRTGPPYVAPPGENRP